ncbi:MAG: DsrH/TusB family sulfur metabolism protein [Nitrospirota bacterium]
MLVIVKSPPNTADGERGVKLARDMAADVVLIQNGVYFAQKERLGGFCGRAYIIDEDKRLRGLKDEELERDVKKLTYDDLVDLMAENDKVVGMF